MKKNPNKKAGNWGALYNKPQNQVYFKDGGKVKVTAGGEKHVIYKKTTKREEGKVGNIMVNHPTKDKGVWDTIDLTKKAGAKTVQQGVAATKKWHKENPYNNMKKQLTKKQMGGNSPKVKTKTVTTNPGGYSKTIVKTKTIDKPGKQGTISTTKTRPTIKGVASDVASGVRRSAYDFKEAVDKKREQKAANPSPRQQMRQEVRDAKQQVRKEKKAFKDMVRSGAVSPISPSKGGMRSGGSVKKYQAGGATKDSTDYFKADKNLYYKQAETNAKYGLRKEADEMMKKAGKAAQNELRQKNKGKLGYDANGHPVNIKKQLEQEELLRRAKKMGHNTIEEYKNSNWGYGKNYKKATTPKKKK